LEEGVGGTRDVDRRVAAIGVEEAVCAGEIEELAGDLAAGIDCQGVGVVVSRIVERGVDAAVVNEA